MCSHKNRLTQYTVFNIKKKITLSFPNLQPKDYCRGLKNEFETAVINELSVFEPLKFSCSYLMQIISLSSYTLLLKLTVIFYTEYFQQM